MPQELNDLTLNLRWCCGPRGPPLSGLYFDQVFRSFWFGCAYLAFVEYGRVGIKPDAMNCSNGFRLVRAVQMWFAESVATVSAEVALYVAMVCSAGSVFPKSLALAKRALGDWHGGCSTDFVQHVS